MRRFTEVSLGRRQAGLNRTRSDRKQTRRDILFAIDADKLDLYSAKKRARKRRMQFLMCPILINKSMYVMRLQERLQQL